MTTKTVKLLVFITLLVHGIGHIQGVIGSMGVSFSKSSTSVSWLLKVLGVSFNQVLCLVLYLAAAIFGILTALSLKEVIFASDNWQILGLITAIISSSCLILFPNALAMFFNKIGAIAVNLLIYYSILFNGLWPQALFDD